MLNSLDFYRHLNVQTTFTPRKWEIEKTMYTHSDSHRMLSIMTPSDINWTKLLQFENMPYPSQIGKFIQDLPTPCLVVSKDAIEKNCQSMLDRAKQMGVQLRGQTKTHKTVEGAILQTGGTKK